MSIQVAFRTLIEDAPGAQWKALFERLWPGYRSWFLRSGVVTRPSYLESRRALERTRAEVETFAEIMKNLSED